MWDANLAQLSLSYKCLNARCVLFSGGQLNTGGYIQRLRPCYGNSAADIVGRQAAGQHPARAAAMIGQQRPVKGMAGATGKTVRVPFGIEQQPVGNPVPIATDIKIGSAGNADGLDQRQIQPVPDGCSAVGVSLPCSWI